MIIIPARLSSKRLPRKVLCDIDGVPMVVRIAQQAQQIDDVVVATDSKEVSCVVEKHGFTAIMTSPQHNSGTDRVCEAANRLGLADNDIIINLQGDEPLIESDVIRVVHELATKKKTSKSIMMYSAFKTVDIDIAENPSVVKVVTNSIGDALYFSRSLIPFSRDGSLSEYHAHIGIYGYTLSMLRRFCDLQVSHMENIEKLEQLRALDNGFRINMVKVASHNISVDTIDDLERVRKFIANNK